MAFSIAKQLGERTRLPQGFWRPALAVMLLLFALKPLRAADLEEDGGPMQLGHRAYASGEFKLAASLWQPLAEHGAAQAQFYLSNLYGRGEGVEADTAKALSWLTRAAEGGYPAAQFNLGNRYYQGRWVKQDFEKAAYWWRKADAQGMTRATFNLAGLYYQGKGVKQDRAEALRWYRKAAEAGSTEAKVVLSKLEDAKELTARENSAQPDVEPPAVTTPAAVSAPPPVSVAVSTPEESKVWIKQQPPSHYTIQLFAANSVPAIEDYLKDFQPLHRLAVFGFAREGKPYYAVIHGSYPSAQAAKAVADRLTGVSTWLRSFASVRQVMAE
jgi:uncharacterized protein